MLASRVHCPAAHHVFVCDRTYHQPSLPPLSSALVKEVSQALDLPNLENAITSQTAPTASTAAPTAPTGGEKAVQGSGGQPGQSGSSSQPAGAARRQGVGGGGA